MGSNGNPERVNGLTGGVVRAPLGTGSKSEREAVWLETMDRRRFVLADRRNGPSFGDRESSINM